jgi:hypothetical protein
MQVRVNVAHPVANPTAEFDAARTATLASPFRQRVFRKVEHLRDSLLVQ